MRTEERVLIIVIMLLGLAGPGEATIVELDLISLGCPTEFNWNMQSWRMDLDLGVTFVEISNVYMDWSGSITAGLAIDYDNPGEPFPLDVGIYSSLHGSPFTRMTSVLGGEATYPVPEPFDSLSEFELLGTTTWSDLLDGQGPILIGYQEVMILDGTYMEHGSVTLDKAVLRIEGTVPEPSTLLFLGIGAIALCVKKRKGIIVL